MSLFNPVQALCPKCGAADELQLVASIAADRRPDLRKAILDGRFQVRTCTECDTTWRLPPNFTYMHLAAKQWILAEPADGRESWADAEAATKEVFDEGYGPSAPPAAQRLGAELQVRVVFGWPALREKLVAFDLGLDDVSLELLKIAVLRSVPEPPFGVGHELRLDDGNEASLALRWIRTATEECVAQLSVPRDVYDDIAGDEAWSELREEVSQGPFVDMERLMIVDEA